MEDFAAVQLRQTHEHEVARVLELEADPEAAPFILAWSEEQHRRAMSDVDQAHLALEVDGGLAGFVLLAGLTNPHHSVELRRIVVSPPGQGLGRSGLALTIDFVFGRLRAHRLWLDVKVANLRGQRAYEHAGFIREGVLREVLLTDGTYESLIVMSILESERQAGSPADTG
jgi:diamine N-acetyltransferase